MARFGSVAELAAFLSTLDTGYAQYAAALWQKDIRISQQLSNAREHILRSAGLSELHIDDIKARAGVRVAGSLSEGMAAEGRTRKWGSNMVHVTIKGVSTKFTPVQLYLAPGESDQSATSGHILMDNLRTIMHGLPENLPIMFSEDVHAVNSAGEHMQRDVNDLSQKQFTADAKLAIWPGTLDAAVLHMLQSAYGTVTSNCQHFAALLTIHIKQSKKD